MSRIKKAFAKELGMDDAPIDEIRNANAKECKYCGKMFVSSDGRRRYCCEECRHSGVRKYQSDYFKRRYRTDEEYREKRKNAALDCRKGVKEENVAATVKLIADELGLNDKQQELLRKLVIENRIRRWRY